MISDLYHCLIFEYIYSNDSTHINLHKGNRQIIVKCGIFRVYCYIRSQLLEDPSWKMFVILPDTRYQILHVCGWLYVLLSLLVLMVGWLFHTKIYQQLDGSSIKFCTVIHGRHGMNPKSLMVLCLFTLQYLNIYLMYWQMYKIDTFMVPRGLIGLALEMVLLYSQSEIWHRYLCFPYNELVFSLLVTWCHHQIKTLICPIINTLTH